MKKILDPVKNLLQPRPNIVVSCRSKDGKDNALAVAYATNCSFEPPMVMVGIVPSRYSYEIIKETKCFVVNIVTKDLKDKYMYIGTKSGRDTDKLKDLDLKIENAVEINAPILSDFPLNIECEVVDSIKTGSHEMFVGKVKKIHADEELLDEKGNICFSKIEYLL